MIVVETFEGRAPAFPVAEPDQDRQLMTAAASAAARPIAFRLRPHAGAEALRPAPTSSVLPATPRRRLAPRIVATELACTAAFPPIHRTLAGRRARSASRPRS